MARLRAALRHLEAPLRRLDDEPLADALSLAFLALAFLFLLAFGDLL